MVEFTTTGKMQKLQHGLVDYLADGYIEGNSSRIPCQIGYTDFKGEIEPTHIFIQDGVTTSGEHYYAETIELCGTYAIHHNALQNMTDYLSKHNYGKKDYPIYSQDPEWQRLNAALNIEYEPNKTKEDCYLTVDVDDDLDP